MSDEQVEQVKKVSRAIESFKRIVDKQYPNGMPPNKEYFDALMRQQEQISVNAAQEPKKIALDPVLRPSLLDEVGKANKRLPYDQYTSTDLIVQTKNAVQQIDELKQKLGTPELNIKNSVQHLLKNKLEGINDNLKIAFSKAGIEYVPAEQSERAIGNPLARFLDLLSNGQSQLQSLSKHVDGLAESKKTINPADMLALQIKVGQIQQELEFFTALLNKSLESTKTLMNVQV